MKHVIVLGGGISGLAHAYFLKKKGIKVSLIEKEDRVGGCIRTRSIHGLFLEEGPRSFRGGKKLLELIEELDLNDHLFQLSAKRRYLIHKGRLKSFSFVKLLCNYIPFKPSPQEDESIGTYFSRCFRQDFVKQVLDPFVRGIFGGDLFDLSFPMCFPSLAKGSFIKALFKKSSLFSFREGMETLPQALYNHLKDSVYLGEEIQKIEFLGSKVRVKTNTSLFEGDHVVAAIPSLALATYLPTTSFLKEIPLLSLTTLSMIFDKAIWKKKGFGYLVPSSASKTLLGMIWDSEIFSLKKTVLTVMLKGKIPIEEAKSIAFEALAQHMHIEDTPSFYHYRNENTLPQYRVGLMEKIQQFHHPNLSLLGQSYGGIGLPECVERAFLLAEKICSNVGQ